MTYKAGFVTFWGRPNTGKSTLLNRILGQKISIVTNKPQTTRRMVKGILSRPDGQIVFIDTPGLHQPIDGLSTFMAKQAQEALQGVDALLYLTTPEKGFHDDLFYLDTLQSLPCPVFLVVNKRDLFSAEVIHTVINTLSASFSFQETMVISSLTGEGLESLLSAIMFILPENPPYYDPEILTDIYERDIAGEIIREKIWDLVRQEVPYGVEVRVEEFKERGEVIYIQAIIYVERESHKGILIGDKGKMIKKIGQEARKDLQLFLGKKVYLDLWVKTLINWRKKSEVLKRWGYQSPSS